MGIIGVPAAGRGGRKEVEPMEQQKIDRINQLARKSKSPEGLRSHNFNEILTGLFVDSRPVFRHNVTDFPRC